jgi:hypothetical protein
MEQAALDCNVVWRARGARSSAPVLKHVPGAGVSDASPTHHGACRLISATWVCAWRECCLSGTAKLATAVMGLIMCDMRTCGMRAHRYPPEYQEACMMATLTGDHHVLLKLVIGAHSSECQGHESS